MNSKTEEDAKLDYDERRKILRQVKTQTTVNKRDEEKDKEGKVTKEEELISTVKQSMLVEYTEAGIRLAHSSMVKEEKFLEKKCIELNKRFEGVGEMPEDLKEFRKKIAELVKYDEAEKAKTEYNAIQVELKNTKKELKGLIDEIGTRLKL